MRRIPEMRADDALAMFEIASDVGRGNGRAVAGENRLRRDRAFQLGENLLLQRQFFRRRFEHESRALHRRRKLIVGFDSLQQCRIVTEKRDDRRQPLRQGSADVRHRLEQADRMPCRGEQIGDAVAHQAAADHTDFLFSRLAHIALTPVCFKEPRCSINVISSPVLIDQSIEKKWSCLLCCGLHSGLR